MSWLPLAAILCASPPGIASQVAAVATPAPSADTVALVEIANQIVTGAPKYRPNYVTNIAVVNGYALVGYWDLRNEGGEFLAHKVNGTWQS